MRKTRNIQAICFYCLVSVLYVVKNIIGVILGFFTGFIKIGLLEKQTFNDYFP